MKVRTKKCLKCLSHVPEGTKICPHCDTVFKSVKKKKTWIDKLKRFIEMAGRKRISTKKQ